MSRRRGLRVRIRYGALQRLLADQAFSLEGQRYLKGSAATCAAVAIAADALVLSVDLEITVD